MLSPLLPSPRRAFHLAWDPVLDTARKELVAWGLDQPERLALLALATAALLAILILLGPAGALPLSLQAGCVVGLLAAVFWFASPLTPAGRARRKQAMRELTALTRAPRAGQLGLAVAAGGAVVLAGTPFQALAHEDLQVQHARKDPSSSSGGCGAGAPGLAGDASQPSNAFDSGGGFGGDSSSTGDGAGSSGCGGGGCGG